MIVDISKVLSSLQYSVIDSFTLSGIMKFSLVVLSALTSLAAGQTSTSTLPDCAVSNIVREQGTYLTILSENLSATIHHCERHRRLLKPRHSLYLLQSDLPRWNCLLSPLPLRRRRSRVCDCLRKEPLRHCWCHNS